MAEVLDNLDVQYTLHVHDGDGTIVSGCYGNVTRTCPGTWIPTAASTYSGTWKTKYQCSSCGVTGTYKSDHVNSTTNPSGLCGCTRTITSIGLICGKTTETVESVTITY